MTATAAAPATLVRLRCAVRASPVAHGIHLRGWNSSFTVEGGPGLWRLWQGLAGSLEAGCSTERLMRLSTRPDVRQALELLVDQLREHDMLVEVPAAWGGDMTAGPPAPVARWLAAVAPNPAAAWALLERTEVSVSGDRPVAAVAHSALVAAGLRVRMRPAEDDPGRSTLLTIGDHLAVSAAHDATVGFVTPVGTAAQARRDCAAIARRLGLCPEETRRSTPLVALVGGAAAHRLLCAVVGLPDPGAEPAAGTAADRPWTHPTVLVARPSPLRSEYRPWLGREPDGAPGTDDDRADLAEAMDRLSVLCDPELGVMTVVDGADLPQVPVGSALCRIDGAVVGGLGVTCDAARLAAALTAVEQLATQAGVGMAACGVDRVHADGVLLRRLVHRYLATTATGERERVPAAGWHDDPVARRWWRTLTVRFGVRCELVVRELVPGLHHAQVLSGPDTLSWAVEATAADAAAFAGLSAAGAAQWRTTTHPAVIAMGVPCGAFPATTAAGVEAVAWYGDAWDWPGRTADQESSVQAAMRRLVGCPDPFPDLRERVGLGTAGFVVIAAGTS